MSTLLLLEVVPEIDANPVSFYSGAGESGGWVGRGLEPDSQFFVPDPPTRALSLNLNGGSAPDLRYRLARSPCMSTPHFLT